MQTDKTEGNARKTGSASAQGPRLAPLLLWAVLLGHHVLLIPGCLDPLSPVPVYPDPPARPTGLRVSAVGPDFIEWTWNAVDRAGSYRIQVSTDEQVADPDPVTSTRDTAFRAEGLQPGTSLSARVAAFVEVPPGRQGPWTDAVTGTTTGR